MLEGPTAGKGGEGFQGQSKAEILQHWLNIRITQGGFRNSESQAESQHNKL